MPTQVMGDNFGAVNRHAGKLANSISSSGLSQQAADLEATLP